MVEPQEIETLAPVPDEDHPSLFGMQPQPQPIEQQPDPPRRRATLFLHVPAPARASSMRSWPRVIRHLPCQLVLHSVVRSSCQSPSSTESTRLPVSAMLQRPSAKMASETLPA